MTSQGTATANQEYNATLCPTHKCEYIEMYARLVCPYCQRILYDKITELKMKAAKARRHAYLSQHPKDAGLWEGLK